MAAPARIILVDDSPVVLEASRQALADNGFEVFTLENPLSLAHMIRRQKVDLVLIDINMPAVSGDAVTQIIRRFVPNQEVCILLHSDIPVEELAARSAQCGANGYIRKTGNPKELCAQVEAFLRQRGKPPEGAPA